MKGKQLLKILQLNFFREVFVKGINKTKKVRKVKNNDHVQLETKVCLILNFIKGRSSYAKMYQEKTTAPYVFIREVVMKSTNKIKNVIKINANKHVQPKTKMGRILKNVNSYN